MTIQHLTELCNFIFYRIISKVPPDAPQQTFFNVANDFFQDGVMSWGRVATLFYFAYKMALKVIYTYEHHVNLFA